VCRYILDTDCTSLILYNHPQVTANAAKHQVAVTIITVQELFNGWIGKINDPSLVHNLPALYSKLWTTVKYLPFGVLRRNASDQTEVSTTTFIFFVVVACSYNLPRS
jgi:hypothetical protein